MSSDAENSFGHDNLQEKTSVEYRIPRSPAVEAYESYAAWRKKKFPPRPLDYKAEDYTLPKTQAGNDNYSNPNPAFQKSSYFPTDTQNPSENYSNRNPPDSMLPRSSYFSLDSENLSSTTKSDPKRSIPSDEDNHQRYNPKSFQASDKESQQVLKNSSHIIKSSSTVNKISKEAQHCLKMYSARSDNPYSPLNSSPKFSTRTSNSYSPTSQNSGSSGNLRIGQKEFVHNSNYSRKSPVDYDPRSNQNAGALQPVRYKSNHRHSFPSCPAEHRSREPENAEMVKGLLKIIDNQSEQIRNLQAQLDRLLKIHEETLKANTKCICVQTYNATMCTKNSAIAAESYSNQGLPKIHESNQVSSEPSSRRNVQFEEHSKKTLMERKVSIGVMTSFEFTVQNSPFNLEAEDQPVIEEQQDEEIYGEGEKNSSNVDLSRKKQNLFSLMPSPLENIIEDSESHLSSSQQPSSNCLSSCKSGNLQTQNGKSRITSGNISNNTNNPNFNNSNQFSNGNKFSNGNNFYNSNSPSSFNNSNQNGPSTQNYSNNTNNQNRREIERQNTEIRNQRENHAGCDFPKQNASPVTRTEPVIREMTPNSRRSGTPREFQNSGIPTRSPDFCRGEQSRRESQGKKFDRGENIRSEDNYQEESLILSGGQLEVRDRIPPSPEPSIHVDMQEYSSEEGSDHTKRTPKVGWTFYNNVLGQVNHILQNSPIEEEGTRNRKGPERQELDKNILMDTVKAATMDQLKKLGISFVDNNEAKEANKKVTLDTSYYSRLNPEMNMMQGTSIMTETNTSMHMKALAMKYLKEEQVCDAMPQKQRRGALKNIMLSNIQGTTNMSFATMRYLQRYQLLPESMNGYIEDEGKENFQLPQISENQEPVMQKPRPNLQNRPALAQTTKMSCPSKILDISTLKQQPKLL